MRSGFYLLCFMLLLIEAGAAQEAVIKDISERLASMDENSEHKVFELTIAADIPDNTNPSKVHLKQEPGHVFIILEQKDTVLKTAIAQVWGFYPIKPVTCIIFRTARCELRDNGTREYNAAIKKVLTEQEFITVKHKAVELAKRKYNINKYNCYDYAIELFNVVAGEDMLPVTHVKFPFILGRGGSPVCLYADLMKLKSGKSVWADSIRFGNFSAPGSTARSLSNVCKNDQ